eukprot:6182163-Pleurochrysis_carterae.AAC.4
MGDDPADEPNDPPRRQSPLDLASNRRDDCAEAPIWRTYAISCNGVRKYASERGRFDFPFRRCMYLRPAGATNTGEDLEAFRPIPMRRVPEARATSLCAARLQHQLLSCVASLYPRYFLCCTGSACANDTCTLLS